MPKTKLGKALERYVAIPGRRERVVTLYHFTLLEHVEAIQRDGLRALLQRPEPGGFLGCTSMPVVHLTSTPTSANTDDEHAAFQQFEPDETIVSRRWLFFHSNEPLARFTICLPPHDRKLQQYGQWYRANRRRIDGLPADPDDIFMRRAMGTWWLYFGDIPPSKVTECITEEATPAGTVISRHVASR